MSLYVRVFTNFYTHRKTARLRVKLGADALWIPPRIWSYAAENQPDGDFTGYSAEEIAMLIGYSGDAQALLEALLEAGFMDEGPKVHDWNAHNGYHHSFSARAKKAAAARWKGQDKTGKEIEKKGKERRQAMLEHERPRFKVPSIDDVKLLMAKAGLPDVEAEKFLNYYESNGWKVGRNPMKSLPHAVGNWKSRWEERRGPVTSTNGHAHPWAGFDRQKAEAQWKAENPGASYQRFIEAWERFEDSRG